MEQIFFGQRIAALRKARGMTQEMLAQKLGITNQAVSKWEGDQCCPDIMQLPALADVFEISLDALFGRAEPKALSPRENPVIPDLPWADNDDLHAVCYVGHQLVNYQEIPNPGKRDFHIGSIGIEWIPTETVMLAYTGPVDNIYSDFSVTCQDVKGNIQAGDSVACGNIQGNAIAGDSIRCGTIDGSAQAGGDIRCDGTIGGNAQAGGDLTCAQIGGRVQCDGDVECRGSIQGDVKCEGDITCGDIGGNAAAEGDISCSAIHGNACAGGDLSIR